MRRLLPLTKIPSFGRGKKLGKFSFIRFKKFVELCGVVKEDRDKYGYKKGGDPKLKTSF